MKTQIRVAQHTMSDGSYNYNVEIQQGLAVLDFACINEPEAWRTANTLHATLTRGSVDEIGIYPVVACKG